MVRWSTWRKKLDEWRIPSCDNFSNSSSASRTSQLSILTKKFPNLQSDGLSPVGIEYFFHSVFVLLIVCLGQPVKVSVCCGGWMNSSIKLQRTYTQTWYLKRHAAASLPHWLTCELNLLYHILNAAIQGASVRWMQRVHYGKNKAVDDPT